MDRLPWSRFHWRVVIGLGTVWILDGLEVVDTVGRKIMISASYLGSAASAVVLGVLLSGGTLTEWSFIALVGFTFFLASAGASAAYLTVSEIFPMETRALASPSSSHRHRPRRHHRTAALRRDHRHGGGERRGHRLLRRRGDMAIGGIVEIFVGVDAEGQSLKRSQTADRRAGRHVAPGRRSRLSTGNGRPAR